MADAISITNSLTYNAYYLRTLNDLRFDFGTIYAGNSAVVVRCYEPHSSTPLLLKCYYRPINNGKAIYGDRYKPKELGVISLTGYTEFIDVVLLPWVEGVALDQIVGTPAVDYNKLSTRFDATALQLLNRDYAHGDIKPDNIIIDPSSYNITLVDWDAAWIEGFTDEDMEECGTAIFSHPRRCDMPFNKHIDDFSIAIMSTMLAALAADREFFEPQLSSECSLFYPTDAISSNDALLNHAIKLFGRVNDAVHYRIASSIIGCQGPIHHLAEWLNAAAYPKKQRITSGTISRLGSSWGIKERGQWVIPPLYDYIDTGDEAIHLHLANYCHTIKGSVAKPLSLRDTLLSEMSNPKSWTTLEEERMLMWYCDAVSVDAIAKALSRSPQAVRARLNKIIRKDDRPRIEHIRERVKFR